MRRLLIIGRGDVALRMLPLVRGRQRIYALTRNRGRLPALRAEGLRPVWGDLDRPDTLAVIAGLAHDFVHFAPPPAACVRDTRTMHLIAALSKREKCTTAPSCTSARAGLRRRRRPDGGDEAPRSREPQLQRMKEPRWLSNRRVKRELRVALRYPSVHDGIGAAGAQQGSA